MAAPAVTEIEIRPQPGPQEDFLSTPADICLYGGAAGGGKTWSLLVEPLRHLLPSDKWPNGVPDFSGVIFRRVSPQIRNEGGLWDESNKIYPLFGATPKESILEWQFSSQYHQTLRFSSLQHNDDRFKWQGAQIPFIGLDELTHFTEDQFWYLLSRNRSMCGIKPYVRATCNPDADSWVAELIQWWINQDQQSESYGLPIPERTGVVRYFIRLNDVLYWGDTVEELTKYLPQEMLARGIDPKTLIKSFTFIPASIYDNKKLLEQDPEYLGNLLSLQKVERERLLGGNWKTRATAGNVFNREWFKRVPAGPVEVVRRYRAWDKAGTDEHERSEAQARRTPFTAGVRMSKTRVPGGFHFYIEHAEKRQVSALKRERFMQEKAQEDPDDTRIILEQEPGSGGKESAEASIRGLAGYNVRALKVTGDKVTRAGPLSAQAEAGNVFIVDDGTWDVETFLSDMHNFPDQLLKDYPDASSLAFNALAGKKGYQEEDFPAHTR